MTKKNLDKNALVHYRTYSEFIDAIEYYLQSHTTVGISNITGDKCVGYTMYYFSKEAGFLVYEKAKYNLFDIMNYFKNGPFLNEISFGVKYTKPMGCKPVTDGVLLIQRRSHASEIKTVPYVKQEHKPENEPLNVAKVKEVPEVNAEVRPAKEDFDDVIKRIGKTNFMELCSYLKNGGLTRQRLIEKYNVTSWFLNNLSQVLGFVSNERNDKMIEEYNEGKDIYALMQNYDLKPTRFKNIINYYRVVNTLSKETF